MNRSKIAFLVSLTTLAALGPIGAFAAGVGGTGNTADLSIEFAFVKSTGILLLKTITPKDVLYASGQQAVADLYEHCREQMFVGAVNTTFKVLDQIPDGGKYHALAQRMPGYVTQISRTELERMMKAGTYSGELLTALFLHEVGHDCRIGDVAIDKSYDPQLNAMGEALVRAGDNQSLSYYLDLNFVSSVRNGKAVRFEDLSVQTQQAITRKYLDYVGDWAYLQNLSLFTQRPAPASEFYADQSVSWFMGWGHLTWLEETAPAPLRGIQATILKSSFQTGRLTYASVNGSNQPLPTQLHCVSQDGAGDTPSFAACDLDVSWDPVPEASIRQHRQRVSFQLDLFGHLSFTKLEIVQ